MSAGHSPMHESALECPLPRRRGTGARANDGEVPRLKSNLRDRRAWPQPEISLLRIDKQRVGNEAVLILSHGLPLGETLLAEKDRLPRRVPVQVAVKDTD